MKNCCQILLLALAAEVLSLFLDRMLGFSGSTFMRLVCTFCTVGVLCGLMLQGGFLAARADREKRSPTRAVLYGAVGSAPFLACWGLLVLARLGKLPADLYRHYKLLCAPFLAVCDLLSPDVVVSALPKNGFLVLFVMSLLPGYAVGIAYSLTGKAE